MEFVRNRIICTSHPHEICEFAFESGVLLTQDFDLALDQRDRRSAAYVRQAQSSQHCLVTLEEIRVVLQVRGDRRLLRFHGYQAACFSCGHSF